MRQTLIIGSLMAMTPASGMTPWRWTRARFCFLELVDLERALHQQPQHVGVHGLLVEIVGAQAHGTDGVLLVELAGDHDHLGARGELQGLEQGGKALGDALGVRRQAQVLQHDRRLVPAQGRQGRRPVGRRRCTS